MLSKNCRRVWLTQCRGIKNSTRDVMKLVKVRIREMQISSYKFEKRDCAKILSST